MIRASQIVLCKLHTDGEPALSFTYDANGNTGTKLAAGITKTYTWDMDDKMTGLTTSNGSQGASYAYARNGDRLQRTLNGVSWTYLYNREDILKVSYASGDPMYLTQGPGIDDVLAEATGSNTSYAYKSMLSNVGAMTDGSSVTQFYRYDAWGQASIWPNPIVDANLYGYTGREWDAQGSYYYRYRIYDCHVARFLSYDPAQNGFLFFSWLLRQRSLYLYAWNRPLSVGDPLGLDVWLGGIGSTGFFAGLGGLSWGVGSFKNVQTGESCIVRVDCWHIGIGVGLWGSINVAGWSNGPHCGYGLNGVMHGVGTNAGSATWDQSQRPGKRAGSYSAGPTYLGLFGGYQGCVTEVLDCNNSPCKCE